MADRDAATANLQDQPIWVQDLLAWLERIEGQGRTEQWVALVQEVLAELPGQGLPEEFWSKDEDEESIEATEAVQDEVVEELPPLSDDDRDGIQQELKFAKEDDGYWNYFNFPLRRFKAAVTKIPAAEYKLLELALEATSDVRELLEKSDALAVVAAKIPAASPLLQQVLKAIKKIKDEALKSKVLVAVQISAAKPPLQNQALDIAKSIQNKKYQSEALAVFAAQLPVNQRRSLLQEALEVALDIQNEKDRSKALVAVTAKIPAAEPQLLQQALEVASDIQDLVDRLNVFVTVAAQIPAAEHQLLQQALEVALEFVYEIYRSEALAAVAAKIPAAEPRLLQQCLLSASAIEDEKYQLLPLEAVAARIPAAECRSVLKQVFDAASALWFEEARTEVDTSAAYQIPAAQLQAIALAALAAQLPPNQRKSLLEESLKVTSDIQDEFKAEVLAAVAAQIPAAEHQLLQQALVVTLAIQDGSYFFKAQALAAIAAQLPDDQRKSVIEQALDTALAISDEEYFFKAQALAAVAAQLPDDQRKSVLEQALDAASDFQERERKDRFGKREPLVAYVAAQLSAADPQLLKRALNSALDFEYKQSDLRSYRVQAFEIVAAQLSAADPQLLEQALNAALDFKYRESYQAQALEAISARLTTAQPQLLTQIIQIAFGLKYRENRITTLNNIAFQSTEFLILYCPQTQLSTLLDIIPKGKTSEDKTRLLSALTPRLSPDLFPKALKLIQTEITHPSYQAESLGNLATYLPSESLSKALELLQSDIPGYSYPATALCNLIPYLSPEQLKKALEIAEIRCPYPELLALILHQAAIRLSTPTFMETEPSDSNLKDDLIGHILNRTDQYLTAERAITNVLTALAPSLDSDKRLKFIKDNLLPKLKSEFYLSQVLAALSTSPGGVEAEVIFTFFRLVESGLHRLALRLFKDYKILFKEIAEGLQQDRPKATALSAFIPLYPELHGTITALIEDSPNSIRKTDLAIILATRPHPKHLNHSASAQLAADQTYALRLVREQPRDVDKANSMIKLAPHLLQSQIPEAQSITQDIQDPYDHARSLLALATHFPEIRVEAQRQIEQVKNKRPKLDESFDKYLFSCIELLSQFATTVPEQIPTLLKAIEDWADKNKFKEVDKKPDPNTYKRRRILIALKPHLPIRLVREIDRQTGIGKAPQDLWERALFVLRTEYRQALKTGSLRNDATQDEDLLNLKDEINALTEMLLMRDLEPPVAVGILGGWGGGKSYIMHLMQTHMVAIRSQGMEGIEAWGLKEDDSKTPDGDQVGRFVGHIYQIKFDAWTYAKGNLWASLMQTIFFELDRQIALEQQLAKVLAEEPDNPESLAKVFLTAGQYWSVLYKASEDDRAYFLEKVLPKEKFDALQDPKLQTAGSILWEKFLWEQYGKVKDIDQQKLAHQEKRRTDIEAQKAKKEEEVNAITKNIEEIQQKQRERKVQLQAAATSEVSKAIDSALHISKIILIKRLGEPVFEAIKNQVETELKQQNVNTEEIGDLQNSAIAIVTKILEEGKVQQTEAGKPAKTFDLARQTWRQWAIKNIWPIVGFVVLSLIAIALPIILQHINSIGAQIAALIVPLVPAIGLAQKLMKSSQTWYGKVEAVLSEYGKQVEDFQQKQQQQAAKVLEERLQSDRQLKQWSSEAIQLEKDKQELNQSLETLKQETAELDQDIKETEESLPKDVYGSLRNFVRSRIEDSSYDKHLGLMHQIKEDLWKLSNSLLPPANATEFKTKLDKLKQVFPRGPARVVVYIDDLDRCPPNTVVEVLEAVQLLVKNPLFIAVLAIDERYINRALAQHYKGVLSLQGSPSSADYLEKIIQIPYRVRPIAEDALRAYLRAQTVIQDSETSGTKFNEFSPQEFNLLVTCCQEVELSPRSLKRLTNVYKLYKVLSRTRGQRPTPREQQAILTLLAFSSRYPDLMRGILQEIGSHYEEGRHQTDRDNPEMLANIFKTACDKYNNLPPNSHLAQDAKKLRHDVTKLVADDLKLNEIHDIFTFVRTFSFVGDIGVDITASTSGDRSGEK